MFLPPRQPPERLQPASRSASRARPQSRKSLRYELALGSSDSPLRCSSSATNEPSGRGMDAHWTTSRRSVVCSRQISCRFWLTAKFQRVIVAVPAAHEATCKGFRHLLTEDRLEQKPETLRILRRVRIRRGQRTLSSFPTPP